MGETTINSVGQAVRATVARVFGGKNGQVHIGKGKLADLSRALADDVDRRMRQFSDDDPTGELCSGCVMMALIGLSEEMGRRVGRQRWGDDRPETVAAFLGAMSETTYEAAMGVRDGKSWVQRDAH